MSGPRAVVLVDSDSYVKWGAALAGRLPPTWDVRLVMARGTAEPSHRQVVEALAGTRFGPDDLERVSLDRLRELLAEEPDVFVAAARGLAVQAAVELAMPAGPRRPVVVSGLPGIAVPVLPFGLGFRRGADLFVLHSRREVRDFEVAAAGLGLRHRFTLATLPFLHDGPTARAGDDTVPRDSIVFAAQAMVPSTRAERMHLLRRLADTAVAHPRLRVVVKVRARPGEAQTHDEQHPYDDLMVDLAAEDGPLPPNLLLESGPMSDHLRRATGLVTVSSTALLEAVAMGVPVLALDDFGVDARQINLVFEGSGVLQSGDELVAGRFRTPDPQWLDDNYFHPATAATWLDDLQDLVRLRSAEGLAPLVVEADTLVHRAKLMFYRNLAFSQERSTWQGLGEHAVVWVSLKVARSRWMISRRFRPVPTGAG
ncbi:hypothetical protein HMPREF0063_10936 [Aeromicrobium marinum DSM 15272]|uniref:Uncharacterized protein n=1 Tax=Aeromicrobium marinum DSM 15272 TaxID=585531 RepID=E2SAE6_9ACTN|nr:DUF6716 putative glycosyltransferase [Aeromicrobium marinum]EFQ84220.1 hypothetical protein HMPREF0063_10936 [Aeromicrobium marinum DSM 15272]